MTRLVLDASVLLSATVARETSPIAVLLDAVRSGSVEAVLSERLIGEVRAGLAKPYFRERVSPRAACERVGLLPRR